MYYLIVDSVSGLRAALPLLRVHLASLTEPTLDDAHHQDGGGRHPFLTSLRALLCVHHQFQLIVVAFLSWSFGHLLDSVVVIVIF